MSEGADGACDNSALFADEVIYCITAMMASATEQQVREALRHVDLCETFPSVSSVAVDENAAQVMARVGEEELPAVEGDLRCDGGPALQLALCEFADERVAVGGRMSGVPQVVATRDLTAVLQRQVDGAAPAHTSSRLPSNDRNVGEMMSNVGMGASETPRMVRCVLLLARGGNRELTGSSAAASASNYAASTRMVFLTTPITLRQLNIHVIDMRQPLEDLRTLLQVVYEPTVRSKREVALRSKMQELVSSIRFRYQVLAEVDLRQFIHLDLLELCALHPTADVQRLVDLLGSDKSTDSDFLQQVLSVRSPCRDVLDVKFDARGISSAHGEVEYWQAVLQWVEHVHRQLHIREWRLMHRLLGHRVETNYEVEFKVHMQLVQNYLSHLRNVPFEKIDTVEDMMNYAALVEELFAALTRPTRYPPSRSIRLLDVTVRVLAERLVVLVTKHNVLRMGSPEAQLQCLRKALDAMRDLHLRYVQAAELLCAEDHLSFTASYASAGGERNRSNDVHCQQYSSLLLERAQKLWTFINDHFHYERTLRRTFTDGSLEANVTCSFCADLLNAYDQFVSSLETSGCLWNVSKEGAAEFQRAYAAYERRLGSIDERLALLVGTMLATAQEMSSNTPFLGCVGAPETAADAVVTSAVGSETGCSPSLYRIYSRFFSLRREKIQAVVAGFRMALLEQINREMKDVRERYFEGCHDAIRLAVARFGVTPDAGRILWEKSVQHEMEEYLVRHDAISERGWHQLLHLRTIEYRWCLNEQLAQFFCLPLSDLVTKELTVESEVHGTAYALAYLDIVHGKDKAKWSLDPHVHTAQEFVQQQSPCSLGYAKSRLVLICVGHGIGDDHHNVRDARNFCETIAQRLQDRVVQWCENVRRRIAVLDVFPETLKMRGQLLRVVHLQKCSRIRKRTLEPQIPREMFAFLQDLHMLDSMRLLVSHAQLVSDVRSFFAQNEKNFLIANCLSELICTFESVMSEEEELMVHLATDDYAKVYQSFSSGAQLQWSDEERLQQFTYELSERVYAFCAAAAQVQQVVAEVEHHIMQLHDRRKVFRENEISGRAFEINALVNRLSLKCSNTSWWVQRLQPRLDAAFSLQLQAYLRRWTDEFLSMGRESRFLDADEKTEEFRLQPLRVQIRVVFKEITLSMSPAECRHHWVNELNRSFGWVHTIPTLLHEREEKLLQQQQQQQQLRGFMQRAEIETSDRLLGWLNPHIIWEPLQAIEKNIKEALEVEAQWRRGQQLLNIDVGVLQQGLGDDVESWSDALRQIRELATTQMDCTQPSTLIGGIVIVAEDAQKELGRKLHSMTQYIHSRYRDVVEKQLESCYHSVLQERTVAENCNVINNLDDAAWFLCKLPTIQAGLTELGKRIAPLAPAEEYLKQRWFALPGSCVGARKVMEEYHAYSELIERKVKTLEFRRPFLRDAVKSQEGELERQIDEFEALLKSDLQIHQKMEDMGAEGSAQKRLSMIQEEVARMAERQQHIVAVQNALGVPTFVSMKLDVVKARVEEVQWVYHHVGRAYQRLDTLSLTPFFAMVPRQLHEDLLAVEREVKELPEGVRRHPAFSELELSIEKRLACRRLMHELRSDAMTPLERAERHWATLKSRLHVKWELESITVGDIWRSDPVTNAKVYHDVLEFAQGERRMESQLAQIISFWDNFEFSTTVYRRRLMLIRGWDVVFEHISDHLDSLQGLRLSPFFTSQHVITGVTDWDNHLNLLRQVLEVLMAVQRRWVQLDGIFTGNTDIRQQLPDDAVQFDRASNEFMSLMPAKVLDFGVSPVTVKVQYFLEDGKLITSFKRLEGQLSRVQRALSTYLDLQRRLFPRFFFVGDDDLLEAIGNSGNLALIEKHLPKMFTALASIILTGVKNDCTCPSFSLSSTAAGVEEVEAAAHVVGFASVEGEQVTLIHPVPLKGLALHDWLAKVESGMVATLRQLTIEAVDSLVSAGRVDTEWITSFPLQAVCLAFQVWWVRLQEETFAMWQRQEMVKREPSSAVVRMVSLIDRLALDVVSPDATPTLRHAAKELITLAVYQRDVSRVIESKRITSADDFEWLRVLRLYLTPDAVPAGGGAAEIHCRMADASFRHGFEYLGWYHRLVQTTLTDRCYLTMTQALHTRLGGSPVGPAGSGKTETVKALGTQLGRHVIVFNCADAFDSDAVGRIFLGLCQVGAWGCLDEFNRLQERVLSAVSQQVLTIQESLRAHSTTVTLTQQTVPLRDTVALFITMNPGFSGRSNLPGNLKQLFRTVTMAVPDREMIAEVMLFAQGFRTAERLARKLVKLFSMCEEQLSQQAHYDFGLRALKSVLMMAGELKRAAISPCSNADSFSSVASASGNAHSGGTCLDDMECEFVLQSIITSVTPRLVTDDVTLFHPLLRDFFPDRPIPSVAMDTLRTSIEEVCSADRYIATPLWVEKICQLYHTRNMRHGLMLVGPSGSGKTTSWKTLLRAMARMADYSEEDRSGDSSKSSHGSFEGHAYVINPKAMSKAELFGVFDSTTRDWKDGVFTEILRRIVKNEKGDNRAHQQHWIVFDGDVDPNWVENLNSLLDDNKLYTLPNGDRLSLPPSVRIVFEVQDLRYATPATVSRCGMVWFSHGTVPIASMLSRQIGALYRTPLIDRYGKRRITAADDDEGQQTRLCGNYFMVSRTGNDRSETLLGQKEDEKTETIVAKTIIEDELFDPTVDCKESVEKSISGLQESRSIPRVTTLGDIGHDVLQLQVMMADVWATAFAKDGLLERAFQLIHSERYWRHGVMELNDLQLLRSVQSLLLDGIWQVWKLRNQQDAPPPERIVKSYAAKLLDYAVLWGFGASFNHELRKQLVTDLRLGRPDTHDSLMLLDVEPDPATGLWRVVRERVKETAVRAEQVGSSDIIIPTVDTCRREAILQAWLGSGSAMILCGPPGSGKTMSIISMLHQSADFDAVFLNFSSGTEPENVIRALEQYCSMQNTMRGPVLSPTSGKRLLLFCDEINLPALDQYGTQPVVQFLRQLIERGGYYRGQDNTWVTVEGVQVIGACNPLTDAGRVSLSQRFLRWSPVLFVDFPTEESLRVIYTVYCRAILYFNPTLQQTQAKRLALAMVDMYTATQAHFTSWQQPHYVYSPRDLSRWSRAIYEGLLTWDESERRALRVEGLVRLALHEGLRVFRDRLVEREEQEWADATIDQCFTTHFRHALSAVSPSPLRRPVLYSTILHRTYEDSACDALRAHIEARLEAFCEEEVDAGLVVHDAVVDHVTRIDRVLRQPSGHMLLAGSSGVGKTITARLVAWMNGMTVFRLGVHCDYKLSDYERDLRDILRRAGCKLERICFIFDDSNIMEASFLEYMNALLASGEVPGLFDGDEWGKLMEEIRCSVESQQLLNVGRKAKDLMQQEQVSAGSEAVPLHHYDGNQGVGCSAGTDTNGDGVMMSPLDTLASVASAKYIDTSSDYELYRWFLSNVRRNLHVVFTIDPTSGAFSGRAVTSPALFNRCTIDWFGDWDRETRHRVTRQLTQRIDIMFSCGKTFQEGENGARVALADALCTIHEIAEDVNRIVRLQNTHHGTFITPRHFGVCVRQLQLLYEEKKSASTEQLAHLHSGLAKLDRASDEVRQQRAKLHEHEVVLAENSKKAQLMLDRIVTDTEATKRGKLEAERLRQQLKEEEDIIIADKTRVHQQLAEVEPALREAKVALNTVKPEYLREIRAYTTPPQMVKRVLETVLVVMGEKRADEWDIIKHHIRRDDFLACVKAFQSRGITEEACAKVRVMLQDEGLTYEAALRASKAAGPLLQWAKAQVNYATIFNAMEPLRTRIEQLAVVHEAKRAELERTEEEICAMEASLLQLKASYQEITEEIAAIKNLMSGVAARCERATTLLQQLLDERGRWEAEAMGFDTEVCTILGDCSLAAASLAYFGYFDEHTRRSLLLPRWQRCLQQLRIPFCDDRPCGLVEYLVTPQERLAWEQQGLPKDNLCVENAMILHRCQRYPLLIDPSGVATAFLLQQYAQAKIKTTSFSKAGYLKQLDMAVRFGYPILMQDAEFIDPALGPLLNHEVRRVGGHTLTRLGAQEVEMSSSFRLFLVTRDSHYHPSPGVAGQVCIVNFTVTQSSLESQCRHRVMLHEHPKLDAQRTHILRVKSECLFRLRVLEQELLTSIACSEGSLLENDALTVTLEQLKDETRALKSSIAESEASMQAITAVEACYHPLASAVGKMYFALRGFSKLHELYHYNVDFVFRIVADALAMLAPRHAIVGQQHQEKEEEGGEAGGEEDLQRLQMLTHYIFCLAHHRVRRGMFAQDHIVLAIVLGKLRSGIPDDVGRQISQEEWGFFEYASHNLPSSSTTGNENALLGLPAILHECGVCESSSQAALSALLHQRPHFAVVLESLQNPQHAEDWRAYLASAAPHAEVMPPFKVEVNDGGSVCRNSTMGPTRRAFIASSLLFHIRRDAFVPSLSEFLRLFFDGADVEKTMPSRDHANVSFFTSEAPDLSVVQAELSESRPLILVASSGSDPTLQLEVFAQTMDVPLRVAVMGSVNGLDAAKRYLEDAMANGFWVLLKNLHLERTYAVSVEKKLHRERSEGRLHRNFRLMLSIEAVLTSSSSKDSTNLVTVEENDSSVKKGMSEDTWTDLPASLVEASVVLMYESPPGMKSSLLQTIGVLKPFSTQATQPADKQRIYLAAAWLHAVVMERLLYVPMGWSMRYEFNDTEFWRILQAVDRWVESSSKKHTMGDHRYRIDRERISWPALQTIIGITLYGGKISNDFDQLVLDFLCSQLMSADVFDDDRLFALTEDDETNARLACRSIESLQDVQAWVSALPDTETPLWARLPASASRVISAQHAIKTVERLLALRLIDEGDNAEALLPDENRALRMAPRGVSNTQWAKKIRRFCSVWCDSFDCVWKKVAIFTSSHVSRSAAAAAKNDNENPTIMAIQREYAFVVDRLCEVMRDLQQLGSICTGERKPTAVQRLLIDNLLRDQTPFKWSRSYQTYPTTADQWMADFKNRITHVQHLHEAVEKKLFTGLSLSLGLLFWPSAFLTATKQQAARRQKQSLEQLQLCLELLPEAVSRTRALENSGESDTWHIVGLILCSACIGEDGERCELLPVSGSTPATPVGAILRWEPIAAPSDSQTSLPISKSSLLMQLASQDPMGGRLATPLYVNPRRDVMLDMVQLVVDPSRAPMRSWYERGVCLVAWSPQDW